MDKYRVGHILGGVLGWIGPLDNQGVLVSGHGDLAVQAVDGALSLRLGAVLDEGATLVLCSHSKARYYNPR